jgi:predicted MFS family arabinose efflux permease
MTNIENGAGMSRTLTLLFAIAGGAAVGNLYWAQPLLADIARSFQVSVGAAGALITMTQIGYALGILLVVPLGDTLNRRKLIPIIMVGSAFALLASALAPSFQGLLLALFAVGLSTVAGQILTPLAGDLAIPEERGRIVGTVVSGLIIGILLSRTISGFVAFALGWRAVYVMAAAIVIVLAAILSRVLPNEVARTKVSYGALLRSVFSVVGRHRAAQVTLAIGATMFAVFSMFWTGLTFLLSSAPYGYSVNQIGLVGLVGLAGALAAKRAGLLHDRGWSVTGSGAALGLALVSIALAGFGGQSILLVLLAVLLLDVAVQATNLLSQTRLFSIDPAARSRLNTAFVACNFVGGSIGSALTGLLWEAGRWPLVMAGAETLVLLAGMIWLVNRKTLNTARS